MVEIVEQDYDRALEYADEVIDEFAERRGQPFGWSQFAFEAVDDGNTVGAIVGLQVVRLVVYRIHFSRGVISQIGCWWSAHGSCGISCNGNGA